MSRGFTVVEVLVALVVFSVGLTAVIAGARWGLELLNAGRVAERGVVHATDVLDSLMEAGAVSDGAREWSGGRVEWTVEPVPPLTSITLEIHDDRSDGPPALIGAVTGPP